MNTMHRGFARNLAVCAGLLVALAPLTAWAATSDDGVSDYEKNEVVYVKADAEGDTQGIYVVNEVDANEDGTLTEEADYRQVENLTDQRPLDSARGEVTFEVAEDETFYYRGDLSATTELPWEVAATYFLDGEEVDPEELAGAEGRLTMVLDVKPSKHAAESAKLATYVDNYLLQVTASLDGDSAENVEAPDASIARAGSDIQLTYMVMPGKEATFVVDADVEDFSFDGWQIVGIPLALSIDVDAQQVMGDNADIDRLTDAIADANAGAADVRDGASELADGADALAASSEGLTKGSSDVAQGVSDASSGASQLASAVSDDLVGGAETLASGSATYSSSLAGQASDARAAAGSVDVAAAQAAYETALQNYIGAYVQCTINGVDPAADETAAAAQAAMQQALTDFVTAQATVSGYQSAADALDGAASGYADIDAGIQSLVDKEGDASVYALRDAAQELSDGLAALDTGCGDLDQGIADYTAGAAELQRGARKLSDGASSLADGTQELADQTEGLDGKIADAAAEQLDTYLNPDFTMVDFVNGSSDNIGTVQFVIMTEAIEAPEEDEAAQQGDAAASPDDRTFFEKLKALFE